MNFADQLSSPRLLIPLFLIGVFGLVVLISLLEVIGVWAIEAFGGPRTGGRECRDEDVERKRGRLPQARRQL